MIEKTLKDRAFQAALLAAPLFLSGLFFVARPIVDISWPLNRPGTFLLFVLVYPVLEEAVFRGLLQGTIHAKRPGKKSWAGISVANTVTTVVFCAAHFPYHAWQWSIAVAAPSLLLGYFRDKYGSIKPCIVLHVFFNAGYFIVFGMN